MDQRTVKASHRFDRCLAGGNPLAPDLMTAEERLSEIAQILAGALLRLRWRKSHRHYNYLEKNSLDFPPHRSGDATARQRREVRR